MDTKIVREINAPIISIPILYQKSAFAYSRWQLSWRELYNQKMNRIRKKVKKSHVAHLVISLLIFAVGIWMSYLVFKTFKKPPTQVRVSSPIPSTTPTPVPLKSRSAFIPYWATVEADSDFRNYDRLIFFGLSIDGSGIRTSDPAYIKLQKELSDLQKHAKPIWLGIRMTDTENNIALLNATSSWDKIAGSIANFSQENKFSGVVIDLEISALPTDGLRTRINEFYNRIHKELAVKSIPMAVTIYGDTFYRKRPYDLKGINDVSEEIMVMAYDFHKAGGEPGPNFPFGGKSTYNYDFPTMIRDFLLFVPSDKLTIVFGMYGYDWIVDEKKLPIKPATSLTLHQIRDKFLESCEWEHCIVRRDEEAGESEVDYIDKSYNYHIVWFEDVVSSQKKINHILGQGINSVAFWAWSYY